MDVLVRHPGLVPLAVHRRRSEKRRPDRSSIADARSRSRSQPELRRAFTAMVLRMGSRACLKKTPATFIKPAMRPPVMVLVCW